MVEKIGLILRRTAIQADTRWYVMNPRALPPVTHGSALQAPECLRDTGDVTTLKCAYLGSTPQDRGLFLFIALRWMLRPERVMVWLTENIQACLRIFWQLQHQWFVRDILHLPQGVFYVFVLWPG